MNRPTMPVLSGHAPVHRIDRIRPTLRVPRHLELEVLPEPFEGFAGPHDEEGVPDLEPHVRTGRDHVFVAPADADDRGVVDLAAVSYTHLTLPTIYSV